MLFRRRSEQTAADAPILEGSRPDRMPGGGRTVVGRQTIIRGVVKGEGPILVRGAIEGEIQLKGGLTIAPDGRVDAEVQAESVEISGEAQGTMRAAGRVFLAPTAVFEGDLNAATLVMRGGSVLQGRTRIAGALQDGRSRISH